ncbi:hypothetical protein BZG36_03285 [Bifiguratus adelaidae]|uniref:Protein FRA10AC1 n=1 Tax=Bifiguratus adelaidae TaxID=1938954 RepID=A0A261XZV8_9FUNG|nr:hypothetical protein BZG36_03285 [Bifiguratus adelaidae]
MSYGSTYGESLGQLNAYDRHKKLINDYYRFYAKPDERPGKPPPRGKTEYEILRETHKFVWDEEEEKALSWEQRLAKKYYSKLFKEYAICDLRYAKQGKIAMRWRIEKEVISGKGQFICASTACSNTKDLNSWEVNFGFIENGEKKNALTKVRLCPDCSDLLNYKTKARLVKREKKRKVTNTDANEDNDRKRSKRHSRDEESGKEQARSPSADERKDAPSASSVWAEPAQMKQDKSEAEEMDDYLADLLQ